MSQKIPAAKNTAASGAPSVRTRSPRLTGPARAAAAAQLKEIYEAGATIRQIAHRTHRSYGGVRALLVSARVPFRGRGGNRAQPTPP
ncbi:helix-turn-helix domain-containing protein [Streptomyces sp. H27-D2]|uniref:helix-turn-helix domain-containing protein n=1 Tax=Streptomyces sp. H27-D2 TaxID=3046304 RepID=UPI003FA7C237